MACFHPMKAFASGGGKWTFAPRGYTGKGMIDLPCGQCIGCRIDRSRQWALRCVHEASLYKNNCFITLTFHDKHLNDKQTLIKEDFQNFMKRLRKHHQGIQKMKGKYPIRYFHCGEYGSGLQRPHHHACIFNFDFDDKELWSIQNGHKLYRSPTLEKRWKFGYSLIGDVTFQSAAYVARYITKKINGEKAQEHYEKTNPESGEVFQLQPEYITMSRRPGIGQGWFEKFSSDLYPKDFITHDGKKYKPPAYYDKMYDMVDPKGLLIIKDDRVKRALAHLENNTPERLAVREKVQQRKCRLLQRGIEL